MAWTEIQLTQIPEKNGFRLRGLNVTRLETFTNAAFAFATTLLIISFGSIPQSYQELITALKDIPAFAASFASVTFLWIGHRKWSRWFGLEDMTSILISLGLIFIMLVYVYPLKFFFSALFAWISGGALPTSFILKTQEELTHIFIIYGLGYAALMLMFVLLHVHALAKADELCLNPVEKMKTKGEINSFIVLAGTGLLSALFALFTPPQVGIFAGFVYMLLSIFMPVIGIYYSKKVQALESV